MRDDLHPPRSGQGWTLGGTGLDDLTPAADVRLSLPARPEHVALVRHLLCALASRVGLPEHVRVDLELAVTEACTNVVRHAYRDREGRIEVVARPSGDSLQVTVSDRGHGISLSPDRQGPGLGLGLISALADRLEIDHAPGEGSHLQMWFARHRPISETA